MANHEEHNKELTHEELKYQEHMKRAADLSKIELFLSARGEYESALTYKPGDPDATEKIAHCQARIKKDRNRVLIILPVLIAIIVLVILFA